MAIQGFSNSAGLVLLTPTILKPLDLIKYAMGMGRISIGSTKQILVIVNKSKRISEYLSNNSHSGHPE